LSRRFNFRHFVAQFIGSMTRRFFYFGGDIFCGANSGVCQRGRFGQSVVLENDVAICASAMLEKICRAKSGRRKARWRRRVKLWEPFWNLRFADGNDFVGGTGGGKFIRIKKMSLAILVNAETRARRQVGR